MINNYFLNIIYQKFYLKYYQCINNLSHNFVKKFDSFHYLFEKDIIILISIYFICFFFNIITFIN